MGVYIKGMEMPKSCSECTIKSWDGEDDVCPFSGISALSIGRQDGCPLVPVPPHGDLIDREETLHKLSNEKVKDIKPNMTWGEIDELIALDIVTMPTIIPAEEGET